MEHIFTISKFNSTKPVLLYVNNGLSVEHGAEWQITVAGKIASSFQCPFFIPDIGKYTLRRPYLWLLSISCEQEGNVLRRIKQRKANCIGHTLRNKCLLKAVIDAKIGGKKRKRRRNWLQLRNDYKDKKGYWKLKEVNLDGTV